MSCMFYALRPSSIAYPPYFPPSFASLSSPSVTTLNAEYPTEFAAFQKCLDYNDYRFNDCRKTERALLDSWNAKMGYSVAYSE